MLKKVKVKSGKLTNIQLLQQYINIKLTCCTLNLHNVICQLYLNQKKTPQNDMMVFIAWNDRVLWEHRNGHCGRQSNSLSKDVHVLTHRTYKYVTYMSKRN